MLHRISVKNFKAFQEADIECGKLNIFIGKNNSGKSSIISLVNVIAQTIQSKPSTSPFLLNGPFDNVGTFQDVVHGHRSNTPISFSFETSRNSFSYQIKYRLQRREIELTHMGIKNESGHIYKYNKTKNTTEHSLFGKPIDYYIEDRKARFRPRIEGIIPSFPFPLGTRFIEDRDDSNPERLRSNYRSLREVTFDLNQIFSNFDSLSPFRAPPQRTYIYTGERPSSIGINGENAINILVNDASGRGKNKGIIEKEISDWFQRTNVSNGLEVRSLTPRHFEICLLGNDNRYHNVSDVGFGCSQVLPVLVCGLNAIHKGHASTRRRPIICIQEPEIHLHPNAQASLGDFFVNIARSGAQLFIETHSDNLILRIARHIALGHISENDVKVYWIEQGIAGSTATKLQLDKDGTFLNNIPGGFFPQRSIESLELAKAIRKETDDQLEFRYLD